MFAFSLANLLLYEAHSDLRLFAGVEDFFVREGATFVQAGAGILLVMAVLTGLVFVLREATRRRLPPPAASGVDVLLLATLVLPAGSVTRDVLQGFRVPVGTSMLIGLAILAVPVGLFLLSRARGARGRLLPALCGLVVVLAPFGGIMVVQTAEVAMHAARLPGEGSRDPGLHAPEAGVPPRRVVWLILDELDEAILTQDRPADVALPAFDAFRGISFVALNATSPSDHTFASIPSLLTGSRLTDSMPERAREFRVQKVGEDTRIPLSSLDTVFSDVAARREQAAIVGWALPYCRMFTDAAVASCHWVEGAFSEPPPQGVLRHALASLAYLWEPVPGPVMRAVHPDYVRYSEAMFIRHEAAHYEELRGRALDVVADERYALVFIHMNVPHPAAGRGFYDRSTSTFSTSLWTGYVDNLVLADQFLASVRDRMQAEGVWDRTAVIISGDHGYRAATWGWRLGYDASGHSILLDGPHDGRHVPFLVKTPRESRSTVYERPMDTIVSRALVAALLAGDVQTAEDVTTFVEASAPSPVAT